LEDPGGTRRVCKESGGGGLAKDRRVREFASLEEAEREFDRKVATKTDPRRKGRKYRAVDVPGAELEGKRKDAKGSPAKLTTARAILDMPGMEEALLRALEERGYRLAGPEKRRGTSTK